METTCNYRNAFCLSEVLSGTKFSLLQHIGTSKLVYVYIFRWWCLTYQIKKIFSLILDSLKISILQHLGTPWDNLRMNNQKPSQIFLSNLGNTRSSPGTRCTTVTESVLTVVKMGHGIAGQPQLLDIMNVPIKKNKNTYMNTNIHWDGTKKVVN